MISGGSPHSTQSDADPSERILFRRKWLWGTLIRPAFALTALPS